MKEESRNFDLFFWVFFGVWKRGKTSRDAVQQANFRSKKWPLRSKGCLGLFIAPSIIFEATALGGPPTSKGPWSG